MKQKNELSENKFSISYDAPKGDYAQHEMDASSLGKAIIAMDELLQEVNEAISNGSSEIELKVTDPVKKGSVIVGFILIAKSATAASILKTIGLSAMGAAITGGTLIEVVQKIRNRKITEVVIEGNKDYATVKTASETFTVDRNVAKLVANKKVRDALTAVIRAPLERVENSTFKVLDSNETEVLKLDKAASESFTALPKGTLEEVKTEEFDANITFTQVNFGSSKGWRVRFIDGDEKSVTIRDKLFLQRVSFNEQAFKKEDTYSVRIEITSTLRPTRSTYEYAIIKVR